MVRFLFFEELWSLLGPQAKKLKNEIPTGGKNVPVANKNVLKGNKFDDEDDDEDDSDEVKFFMKRDCKMFPCIF